MSAAAVSAAAVVGTAAGTRTNTSVLLLSSRWSHVAQNLAVMTQTKACCDVERVCENYENSRESMLALGAHVFRWIYVLNRDGMHVVGRVSSLPAVARLRQREESTVAHLAARICTLLHVVLAAPQALARCSLAVAYLSRISTNAVTCGQSVRQTVTK